MQFTKIKIKSWKTPKVKVAVISTFSTREEPVDFSKTTVMGAADLTKHDHNTPRKLRILFYERHALYAMGAFFKARPVAGPRGVLVLVAPSPPSQISHASRPQFRRPGWGLGPVTLRLKGSYGHGEAAMRCAPCVAHAACTFAVHVRRH